MVSGDPDAAIEAYTRAGAELREFGAQRQAAAAWRELAEAATRLIGVNEADMDRPWPAVPVVVSTSTVFAIRLHACEPNT